MDTVDYYIKDGADYINGYLSGERFGQEYDDYFLSQIQVLDTLFSPSTSPLVVYRGIDREFVDGIELRYVSTSTSKDIASRYSGSQTLSLLEIHIPLLMYNHSYQILKRMRSYYLEDITYH
jgi:hypothetical protein